MTTLYKSKYKSGWIQDYTFLIVTSPRPPTIVKGIHMRTVSAARAPCLLVQMGESVCSAGGGGAAA